MMFDKIERRSETNQTQSAFVIGNFTNDQNFEFLMYNKYSRRKCLIKERELS